jgi:hypothetical protein
MASIGHTISGPRFYETDEVRLAAQSAQSTILLNVLLHHSGLIAKRVIWIVLNLNCAAS